MFIIVSPRVPCCQVGLEAPRPQLRYRGEELHVEIASENPHAMFGYVSDDLVPEALQGFGPFGDLLLRRHVIQVHTHERYRVLIAERPKTHPTRSDHPPSNRHFCNWWPVHYF